MFPSPPTSDVQPSTRATPAVRAPNARAANAVTLPQELAVLTFLDDPAHAKKRSRAGSSHLHFSAAAVHAGVAHLTAQHI